MRKVATFETGKIFTMIILLISICIKASAQSPYAMFGDNSKMLEAKSEPVPSIYRVGIQSPNGANFYADFDLNKGLATLYDTEGNVLRQDSISENAKAMFTSIDPHAESYYHLSPYSYCGGNPVNRIDPTGMDWYQNNKTSYYTWYDGDGAREGFTYIGGKGSVLGEFESIIDNILTDPKGPNLESLYSNGYDGYTSRDGRHINNVVYDSKSNTSLGYRVLNEHRRSHKRAQGNTYQFYIWQSIK